VATRITGRQGDLRVPARTRALAADWPQAGLAGRRSRLFDQTRPAGPVVAEPLDPELLTGFVDVVGITDVTHDVKTFELRAAWMPPSTSNPDST
jgi:hypothetical protein